MLNGLALRNGFEAAPKVRKNRFKCNSDVRCLSSRDFIFDPKCLLTPQWSLIGHPRAILFTLSSLQI
jgi:hypothetical protein